jgi:hypothetical protein
MSFPTVRQGYHTASGRLSLLGSNTHPLVSEKAAAGRPLVPTHVDVNPKANEHRNKLLAYLAALGVGGAALGAGTTSLFGLSKLRDLEEEEEPSDVPGHVAVKIPLDRLSEKRGEKIPFGSWEHIRGDAATSPFSIPWAIPAAIAATGAGTIVPSYIANKIIHGEMKDVRKRRLKKEKEKFNQLMLDQYASTPSPALENEKISSALDHLYDLVKSGEEFPPFPTISSDAFNQLAAHEKAKYLRDLREHSEAARAFHEARTAEGKGKLTAKELAKLQTAEAKEQEAAGKSKEPLLSNDYSGMAIGLPAIAGALSGGLGLMKGYEWAEKRKPENILRKAKEQRDIRRELASPRPIQVEPISAGSSDELEG